MEFVDERSAIRQAFWQIMPSQDISKYAEVVNALTELKVREGFDDVRYLFTADNLNDLYDLYFHLASLDNPMDAVDHLRDNVIPIKNEMIERGDMEMYSIITFESPTLKEERNHESISIALQDDRGVLSDTSACGRCGSEQNHMKIKQTRSVDEGPTTIITCSKCKNCWSEG